MSVVWPATVADLLAVYDRHGGASYGESVTQLAHATQCGELARADGAHDALVAAALLHDVGHLIAPPRPDGWRDDVDDDQHEARGARALAAIFGPEVAAPVALHVTAKRWRCTTDPGYLAALSTPSRATLVAQGGTLDATEAARFEAHPSFDDAVRLRGWDDAAKDPSVPAGSLHDHRRLLEELASRHA